MVVGGPDESEAGRYWALSGFGWFSEEHLAFDHEGQPPHPERVELANQGLIAFVGPDQGLWLMNADGTDRHRINRGPVLGQPQWSPDGRLIAFEGEDRLRIWYCTERLLVDLPGYRGATEGLWLGDNTLLAQSSPPGQPQPLVSVDPAGNVLLVGQEEALQGEDFGSRESPNGRWALSEGETIVYPEFSPQGVSNWVLVSTEDGGDLTVLAEGSSPTWQPETPIEEAAASPLEAAQSVLQYYPFELAEACANADESEVCVEELGSSGTEIVYAAVDRAACRQYVLLFVRPEGESWVVGHLEPAFCQGDSDCPPRTGAIVEVVVKETCVNARSEPGVDGPINQCMGDGVQAVVVGGPVEVDARIWVELQGLGWISASYIRCLEGCN